MIRKVHCFVVECDDCHAGLGEELDEYSIHFDSDVGALAVLAEESWTVTEDGHIRCRRCSALAFCASLGHMWDLWNVCGCEGDIPAHAATGCTLIRKCLQCGLHEQSNLAHLPTIDEPTTPGR